VPSLTEPAYPAARLVAPRVQAYFSRHRQAARAHGAISFAPEPDAAAIEAIIDAGFWASLRREEGYSPRVSLAFVSPADVPRPLRFADGLPLAPRPLARLAPAVERPGIHLGVWTDASGLHVWGTTRELPTLTFVLEVVSPGLLVIKSPRGEPAKYVNIAVLQGDRVKVLDEGGARLPDCPQVVQSLLGLDVPGFWGDTVNIYVQLAVSMRAHGRGGAVLVVPSGSEEWRESIVQPIPYAVVPAFSELAELMGMADAEHASRTWQDAVRRAVDAVAGLTAVDGATIINDRCELLAFGAKIARRDGHPQVEQVILTEPVEGAEPTLVHPSQFAGTRHLSAAQFTQDQRDAVALVASQDGRFTVFKWTACENMVHAHRVDALLL
jgi:hypothetical protein